MNEIHIILLILTVTTVLVLLSAAIGVRWILKRGWKNRDATPTPIGIGILVGGTTVLLCFLYALFIEPYWLDVTHIELESEKIPANIKRIRIAHISDIHSDQNARLEGTLPSVISSTNPDIIVLTGDCINSPEGLPVFRKFIVETSKIAPTFVVKGNWDAWYWNKLDLFGGSTAIQLNGSQDITPKGLPIKITGFPVSTGRDPNPVGGIDAVEKVLSKAEYEKKFSILLYHYPDLIEEAAKHKVDLYCAGHTHGGQVRLPFYGALITLSKFGKRYEAGLYHVQRTTLNVNRGLGMEGSIAPRIRFLCRPELTIIDVIPRTANHN